MLDKKERLVLLYLCEICKGRNAYLVSADDIAQFVSQKYLISHRDLSEIMLSLSKDNYLEYTLADSKRGKFYCLTLKPKAITFKHDQKKERKALWALVGRTLVLTIISFVFGLLLRIVFKK